MKQVKVPSQLEVFHFYRIPPPFRESVEGLPQINAHLSYTILPTISGGILRVPCNPSANLQVYNHSPKETENLMKVSKHLKEAKLSGRTKSRVPRGLVAGPF